MLAFELFIPKHPAAGPPAWRPSPEDWTRLETRRGWSLGVRSRGAADWSGGPLEEGDWVGLASVRPRCAAQLFAAAFGAYICVRQDPAGRVWVQRDPSGRIPAYWADLGDAVFVCSHVGRIVGALHPRPEPDWSYLARIAAGDYLPGRRTALRGIEEILPGEEVGFDRGQVSRRLAWTPREAYANPFRSAIAAQNELRRAAEGSAAFWASQYRTLSVDLSGGLDSSIMLGLLASSPTRPALSALNITVGHAESDERAFAAAAAAQHGVPLTCATLPPVALQATPRGPLQPRPTTRLLGLGIEVDGPRGEVRPAGADAYATGRGGDHLFFARTPNTAAADLLRATHNPVAWLRFAYAAALRTGRPLMEILRLTWRGGAGRAAELPVATSRFVRPEALRDAAGADDLHPWLGDGLEAATPAKFVQLSYLVELQRHYDRIGRAEQIDEVHPFIARPLIEASLATPAYMFPLGGIDRGLERETFRDLIPPAVYARDYKSSTTSRSLRFYRDNLAAVREHLLEGHLVRRGLLDRAALERALTPTALLDGRFSADLQSGLVAELWVHGALAVAADAPDAARSARS